MSRAPSGAGDRYYVYRPDAGPGRQVRRHRQEPRLQRNAGLDSCSKCAVSWVVATSVGSPIVGATMDDKKIR